MREGRWGLWLALSLALALGACGDDEKKETPPVDETPDAGQDADDTPDADEPDADDTPDADEPDADEERIPGAEEDEVPLCTPAMSPARSYSATIRWTSHGIPHIEADDVGAAAFGQAYAISRDHVCNLAEIFLRSRGELAMHFGPGTNGANIEQDFGSKALRFMEDAACKLEEQAPDTRAILAGYVAGYNKYLADVGPEGLPAECAGADWVVPIDELTLLATYIRAAHRASGLPLMGLITSAAPPSGEGKPQQLDAPPQWPDMRHLGIGSNGWGLGRERTANGKGMVLSNTHFPWQGELRWYESHLKIAGDFEAYGVGLLGAAGVLMGFTEHMAWTHTVSTSSRFTFYKLDLVDGDPESYIYDGQPRRMKKRLYAVEVKQPDGTLETVERALYRSHYGPILNVPPFGWGTRLVATYRDANAGNTAILPQWLAMNRARSLEEFKATFAEVHGIPWVNTMAASPDGEVFYTDASVVPNISAEGLAAWRAKVEAGDVFTAAAYDSGIFLFDGGDPIFEWVDEEGTVQPGTLPFSKAPQLQRTDYVQNSNDSHWITHPEALLEDYSPLYGAETIFLPRTQMGLTMLTEQGEASMAGPDGLWTLDELQAMFFADRTMVAERLLPEVVARCQGAEEVVVGGQARPIGPICDVLAAWDGRYTLESVGAVLWREFQGAFGPLPFDQSEIFEVGFDPANPLTTPRGLRPAPEGQPDPVIVRLGEAIRRLERAGLAFDTPLGEAQFYLKGQERLPIHGGTDREGAFNVVDFSTETLGANNPANFPRPTPGTSRHDFTDLADGGYLVNRGASWIMFMNFTDDGPTGRAVMSYSQSAVAASPHFADQTRLFSQSQTRPILFTEADILADPELEVVEVTSEP